MTDLNNRLLLRPGEAADILGVSRTTAYALIANGTVPSVRLGSSVRVPVDELKAYISRQVDEQRSAR